MKLGPETSLRDVAFEVCTVLDRAGTTAVLTGGGAATLYAPEAIQSLDLDLVVTVHGNEGASARALESIGYRAKAQFYEHVSNPFFLEFPPGPLAIGDELIESWDTLVEGDRLLHVLTPCDSCRDRLVAFYHFRDLSSLDQALAIHAAQMEHMDLAVIREWSRREGMERGFETFLQRLEG